RRAGRAAARAGQATARVTRAAGADAAVLPRFVARGARRGVPGRRRLPRRRSPRPDPAVLPAAVEPRPPAAPHRPCPVDQPRLRATPLPHRQLPAHLPEQLLLPQEGAVVTSVAANEHAVSTEIAVGPSLTVRIAPHGEPSPSDVARIAIGVANPELART